jgi:hypothetical protein
VRESAVRKHLHARIKALGGEHRAAKWFGRDHCPDDFVMLPGRHFWVEAKMPGKDAEPGQAREHERMRAAGCEVYVLDTIEKIDRVLPPLESTK